MVSSPGTYGEEVAAEFMAQAKKSGICVAQNLTLPFGDLTKQSARQTVVDMFTKPEARAVMMFVNKGDVKTFLEAVNSHGGAGRVKFIGSETWGNNKVKRQLSFFKNSFYVYFTKHNYQFSYISFVILL